MDAVSLKLARNYTNEKLNSLPSNAPTKTVTFDGGIYSVGSDVVNGQVSDVRIKGQTWTNLAGAGDTSPQTVENLDAAKTYLLINSEGANVTIDTVDTPTPVKLTGATSFDFGWASGEIALYELSTEEATLEASVLGQKYHYVSGTKSTNSVRVKSVGKNLINLDDVVLKANHFLNSSGGEVYTSGFAYNISYIKVAPNTTYTLSGTGPSTVAHIIAYDSNKNFISNMGTISLSGKTFTTPSNCSFIRYSYNAQVVTPKTYEQLELGSTVSSYEPYKESIANIHRPEPLRSVPSAKDEFNASTGVKTQRVSEEVTVNGSLDWTNISDGESGFYRAWVVGWCIGKNVLQSTYNTAFGYSEDGYYYVPASINPADSRFIQFGSSSQNNRLYVSIEKSKVDAMVGADSLAKFKAYLNQFPITLIYQLAEPIITKFPAQAPLQVFENGTVYVEPIGDPSETTLPTVELTVPIGAPNKFGVATHDYGGAAADWVLTKNEANCGILIVTNAGGAANIIVPNNPGRFFFGKNDSGYDVVVKSAGAEAGTTIADGNSVIVFNNGD